MGIGAWRPISNIPLFQMAGLPADKSKSVALTWTLTQIDMLGVYHFAKRRGNTGH
jgi:hypothetical protein